MAEDYKFRKTTLIGLLGKTMGTKLFDWLNPCCDEFCKDVNACVLLPVPLYKVLTVNVGNYPLQTITQFQNTIGDGSANGVTDVKFDYSQFQNGIIDAKMSANPFTAGKTLAFCNSINNGGQPYFVTTSYFGAGWLRFDLIKFDGTQTSNPSFGEWFVEIRVYN